ncbi:hypothetical protein [Polaromonas sp.]|uniref:hypothetical protein n=1 Tax=Polaromonas sp. TaxID=1869339 RepID=UPI00375103F4
MSQTIAEQLQAQTASLAAARTAMTEQAAASATPGKIPWWSVTDAMTISASILLFGLLVMGLATWALRHGIAAGLVLRLFGMLTIIVLAVFLVVAGYDSQQIAPVTGLLGTLAGYLVGRSVQEQPKS